MLENLFNFIYVRDLSCSNHLAIYIRYCSKYLGVVSGTSRNNYQKLVENEIEA